jgi:hypothetical protein
MSGFDEAVKMVLKHEGGYVNHPSDPGGETNFGISKRAYPEVDIANLTEEEAAEFIGQIIGIKLKVICFLYLLLFLSSTGLLTQVLAELLKLFRRLLVLTQMGY